MKRFTNTIRRANNVYSNQELYCMIKSNKQLIDQQIYELSNSLARSQKTLTNVSLRQNTDNIIITKYINNNTWKLLGAIVLSGTILTGLGAMVKTDLETKIDKLETHLDSKIDKLDAKIDKLEIKFDNKIDKLDTKVDRLESKLNDLDKKMEILLERISK